MAPTAAATTNAVRTATIPYLSASAEHSLYKNGKVLTRRDQDGSDVPWIGADLEDRSMPVIDARELAAADQPSLEIQGFELQTGCVADVGLDFLDHEEVVRTYYPQCAGLVREANGARVFAAFDHMCARLPARTASSASKAGSRCRGRRAWSMATTH